MQRRKLKLSFVTFLTFVRLPLVFMFVAGALCYVHFERLWIFVAAISALVVSALTDLFDGYFARRFGVVTEFGAYADPLADKVFYLATLPVLIFVAAHNGHMVHARFLVLFTVVFLFRDQWVSFLRSVGSRFGASAKANWSGKLRTALGFPILCLIYGHEECPIRVLDDNVIYTLEAVAFLLNFISIGVYTRFYWPFVKRLDEK